MIRTILFDFDGVLCFDRFYTGAFQVSHPEVFQWIQKNIFEDRELVRTWMRGQISSEQMNTDIANRTGIDLHILTRAFKESVEHMQLDEELLSYIAGIRKKGTKVALVSDNMDVFSQIVVPCHQLKEKSDLVINSTEYGLLKKDEEGKLFDIALEKMGEQDISQSLLVDNQQACIDLYRSKGGQGYVYKNFDEFQRWLEKQYAE